GSAGITRSSRRGASHDGRCRASLVCARCRHYCSIHLLQSSGFHVYCDYYCFGHSPLAWVANLAVGKHAAGSASSRDRCLSGDGAFHVEARTEERRRTAASGCPVALSAAGCLLWTARHTAGAFYRERIAASAYAQVSADRRGLSRPSLRLPDDGLWN